MTEKMTEATEEDVREFLAAKEKVLAARRNAGFGVGDVEWRQNSTPHFARRELRCRCGCEQCFMLQDVVAFLEALRKHLGDEPIYVTSGYRCEAHNRDIGGAPNSAHMIGAAVDVLLSGGDAYRAVDFATYYSFSRIPVTGLGLMQKGPVESRWLHFDILPMNGPILRPYIWTY